MSMYGSKLRKFTRHEWNLKIGNPEIGFGQRVSNADSPLTIMNEMNQKVLHDKENEEEIHVHVLSINALKPTSIAPSIFPLHSRYLHSS